jgi:hypothetical protein
MSKGSEDSRKARLAAALKENLKRRKAQARAREAESNEADTGKGVTAGNASHENRGDLSPKSASKPF